MTAPHQMITKLTSAAALVAGALTMASAVAFAADAPKPAPQDQTLEEKLEIQEQRIRNLEKRILELEAAATPGKVEKETAPTPAPAPETAKAPAPEAAHTDELPGSWPMFGTDMRIKLGGYLKTDLLYDVDGTTDKFQFLMSTIPVKGTPEHANRGYVSFFARETRFNIDVRRAKPGAVPLSAFIEGDFFSSGNQFRLRHASMTYGDFLIGQTWTTLSFLQSLPFLIDFAAGDALFGGREPQIRYTKKIDDQWKVALALENLSLLGIENPNDLGGAARAQLPLLAFRADYKWRTTWIALGSSIAQLRWDGGASGPTAEALQIDGMFAGRQYVGTDNYFSWNISYGKGSGENILAFAGTNANAVLGADGKLETMPAFAFLVGYWHKWNERLSSNFSYAYGWLDTPDVRAPLALKEGGIGHLNLIWQPLKQFSTGLELIWGTQRTQNDALGSATRIQTMAKFDF